MSLKRRTQAGTQGTAGDGARGEQQYHTAHGDVPHSTAHTGARCPHSSRAPPTNNRVTASPSPDEFSARFSPPRALLPAAMGGLCPSQAVLGRRCSHSSSSPAEGRPSSTPSPSAAAPPWLTSAPSAPSAPRRSGRGSCTVCSPLGEAFLAPSSLVPAGALPCALFNSLHRNVPEHSSPTASPCWKIHRSSCGFGNVPTAQGTARLQRWKGLELRHLPARS